jgi:multicomponent Na+:H+ antiporter subunit E
MAALWWLLTRGNGGSWLIGGPIIVLMAAWRLDEIQLSEARFHPGQLWYFIPFFVWRSLLGSCDVAWRALHRRLPIAPAVRPYLTQLPVAGPARVFFANTVSLLPGTLTASWTDDALYVHVLTDGPHVVAELRRLEHQVAQLFGCEWFAPAEEIDR